MKKLAWAGALAISTLVAGIAGAGSSASAQDPEAILKYAINKPGANYSLYGPIQTRVIRDKNVQGGIATRVEVSAKGESWSVGASQPMEKGVAKGDRIFIGVWARAPKMAEGQTTPISFIGMQLSSAPNTAFVSGSANVGKDWQMFQVSGVADKDYTASQIIVSLQLGKEKTTIDLGPIFVLNLGQKKQA